MTVPTASELNLLKTQPQRTKLFLSAYQPNTVFTGMATGTLSKGATSIPFINSSGSPLLVEGEVFTMLVGTSQGGDEKGRIRVRSVTGTYVHVPINSHIDWDNGDYLTVLRYVEVNPVYQRIIQDPEDSMNTLWYKFSDIEYTNQNNVLGSFVCMGGHYAGFLDGGQCNVYYSASGTYNLRSEGLFYEWFFQGATVTGSTANTPGYISYSTPGQYMTRLRVYTTGSNAASDTSYRFISVYDRPENGSNTPILNWEISDLSGSRENGGYTATIKIRDLTYKNIIRDNALIVIFAEDWYGETKQSIGGNSLNRSNIFYVGYVLNGTIQYNYRDGYIEFETASVTEMMKEMEGYAIDVTSSTDPATQAASDPNYPSGWVLLYNMDVRKAIYHYLRWHSTILFCTDFDVSRFGTDVAIEHFTSDRTSLYDAVNTLIDSALLGRIVSDRQGKIFAEVEYGAINNASGSFLTSMNINKPQWIDDPNIDEKQVQEVSFIELGGIAYDGPSAGTSHAYLSAAPGSEPGMKGKMEQRQGLALVSQDQLNTLAGNIYAYRNARYPSTEFKMNGNWRNLDIAPQEIVSVNIAQTDTPRGIVFTEKPCAIRSMSWNYYSKDELLLPNVNVSEVTQGFIGDTIIIPPVPPVAGDGGGGFSLPPIVIPPFPIGGCSNTDLAPANGPFTFNIGATIRSDEAVPFTFGLLPSIIRRGSSAFKTTVIVNGCKYYSTNNGASWSPWFDTDGLVIKGYSLTTAEPAAPTATNLPVPASDIDGCSYRGGMFYPPSPVSTSGYSVKLEPKPLYFNGLSSFSLVDTSNDGELIDDLRWRSLGSDPDFFVGVIAKLTFTTIPSFISSGGILIFDYIPTAGGVLMSGTYMGTMKIMRTIDVNGGDFDPQYGIPPPYGLSGDTTESYGGIGYLNSANSTGNIPLIGDNYIAFHAASRGGTPLNPYSTTFQFSNIFWKPTGQPAQLLMISRINRIDVTTLQVYNVCFD